MRMALFSIIVTCYRCAIYQETQSLPRCVHVYTMQINSFFMLKSAL